MKKPRIREDKVAQLVPASASTLSDLSVSRA